MSDIGTRVGKRLRELRDQSQLTQADLAERMGHGVAVETISRYERGSLVPSLNTLTQLTKAMGVELDMLFVGLFEKSPLTDPVIRDAIDLFLRASPQQRQHALRILNAFFDTQGGNES